MPPFPSPTRTPRSPAQAEASRRNGARSKGPITPQGKARSRLNGMVHGLSAQLEHLLPGAVADGLAAFRDELATGGSELVQAIEQEQLAGTLWLRTRATALEMAVLSGLQAQMLAGAFRPHPETGAAPAEAAATEALEAAADRQLQRLLLFARYGTRLRRELDRLLPKETGGGHRRSAPPAQRSSAPGSPREPEFSQIKPFSGSLGKIEPPPPLPTDPEEGRPLRQLTLDALGLDATQTFILEQLQQQERLGQPLPDLLVETDLTLTFWHSDGVALPRVRHWRDQLATRLATPASASDSLSRRAGESLPRTGSGGGSEGIGAPAPAAPPVPPSGHPSEGSRCESNGLPSLCNRVEG
jgi:hypothetical protein